MRILFLNSNPVMREVITRFFRYQPEIECHVSDRLEDITENHDVVVIDEGLIRNWRSFKRRYNPKTPVFLWGSNGKSGYAGFSGFFSKNMPLNDMVGMVLLMKGMHVSKKTLATRKRSLIESQILRALLQGASNKEIAHQLHKSIYCIKYHAAKLYQEFDVGGRKELIRKVNIPL
ncbi:MAG: LuxR C-terminal-related transcriptional regulator [Alphaproteobacteria bacterium]|nr:LuxR C-terminal-related transcriptional regulator [Alphaproteobacteria bacterium]